MKVRDLGEFGIIETLRNIANVAGVGEHSSPEVIAGIGDDAAVLQNDARMQLGTTDMLVQDVHFSVSTTSWHDLGWKALAVNISDIAAMGGIPTCAMISLGMPPETEVDHVIELYQGMAEIARIFNMTIAGGDISESPVMIISPCVVGKAFGDTILYRSTALPGDKIAVTGFLGSSAAGLRLFQQDITIENELRKTLHEVHLRPYPRVSEALSFVKNGGTTAIDISDGLVSDLTHICQASNVGANIDLDKIPIHPATLTAFPDDATQLALTGGEDYELLFAAKTEVIEAVQPSSEVQITIIGEITEENSGKVTLLDDSGKEIQWNYTGWQHFRNQNIL